MSKSMKTRSRPRPPRCVRRLASGGAGWLLAASLAACAVPPPAPVAPAPAPVGTPRAVEAALDHSLDALQRQSEPASDDVIASLERALRDQREKRARSLAAAAPAASSPVSAPALVARAAPAKAARPARGAKAKPARAAAPAPQAALAAPGLAPAIAPPASADAPQRSPMARIAESRESVDDLYARAQTLERTLQAAQAVALYREASQRGHAPSSRRLMELYADGAPGVSRDYRVAVFFKARAVEQGVSFEPAWR
jgi:hypothetical protein